MLAAGGLVACGADAGSSTPSLSPASPEFRALALVVHDDLGLLSTHNLGSSASSCVAGGNDVECRGWLQDRVDAIDAFAHDAASLTVTPDVKAALDPLMSSLQQWRSFAGQILPNFNNGGRLAELEIQMDDVGAQIGSSIHAISGDN